MGGGKARRQAQAAAEASNREAAAYREQTDLLRRKIETQAMKAQRILMRGLRARGQGIFETDFIQSPLGGTGTTGL